jgi:uracil-DNA glycosylase family 4
MRSEECKLCKLHQTCQTVGLMGTGPTPCDIMIVGEAPGRREDEGGEPFIGKAGQLLTEILASYGISRKRVYITNAVHCRPPDNRTPTKSEIKKCKAWLDYEIQKVRPKFVLLLGNTPLMSITGSSGISTRRGRPFEQDGIIYLPTFHPAFALRDPTQTHFIESDVRLLCEIVKAGEIPREEKLRPNLVRTTADFKRMLAALRGIVSFDIETTCLYPWQKTELKTVAGKPTYVDAPAKITMIGFGTSVGEFSLPLHHLESPFSEEAIDQMIHEIDRTLEEYEVELAVHNGKFDGLWMWVHYAVKWYQRMVFDTMLAHYALDENSRHGLKELAMKFCGAPDWDIDKDKKRGNTSLEKLALYHAHDLYYTLDLRRKFRKMLLKDPESHQVFMKILMPCARMFTEIEYSGIYIDHTKFDEAEEVLRKLKDEAEQELKQWGDINWGSTAQLSDLLYNQLKIPVVEKTKTGAPSCSESALNQIDHPCVGALIRYRGAKQQLSFFIDGWKPFIHWRRIKGEKHAFLHPSFKLHGTVTGRLSCEHPNLQQVPRDPRIRTLITAPPGWTLIECDLSQIELRVAAELANERTLLQVFYNDGDPHWTTVIRSLERGAGGEYLEVMNETAAMFLVSIGLPPDGTGAKILLDLWRAAKERVGAAQLLQSCYKEWSNKESRLRQRWQSEEQLKSLLERGWPDLGEKVQGNVLRALRVYFEHLSSSQERKQEKQPRIQFGDVVSILSCLGASVAEEFRKEWKELRKKAKAENFGFLYGMWWKKFLVYARDNYGVNLTETQAQESRESFFALYVDLPQWHNKQRHFARRNGYVRSLSGRKRRLPNAMLMEDTPQRREAERQAINSPVQSFANDINLMSAIQLRKEYGLDKVRIVGTVHDAILAMVKDEYLPEVMRRLLTIMTRPKLFDDFDIQLKVPVLADGKVGPWGAGISLEKWEKANAVQSK